MTRRDFVRGGVAAFTVSFGAPRFISELALAQGQGRRNLVVLYLSGGNDALSTVIPYTDPQYIARRPTLAIPAANVLQIGSDSTGKPLGLHPRLGGLRTIFNAGRLAVIQRTGYANSSRSHFEGTDIWSTGDPSSPGGFGWLGRYLDRLPSPVDPLVAWSTTGSVPRTLQARTVGVPAIPNAAGYAFTSPNGGADAGFARDSAIRIASHVPVDRPHLAFVNATAQAAFATLDRVQQVGAYRATVTYPNNGLGLALRTVAGAMANQVGTRVFWVQTGGFDTHAGQGTNANGNYAGLMGTLDGALSAFYADLLNQGLLGDTRSCCSSRNSAAASTRTPVADRPRRGRHHARDGGAVRGGPTAPRRTCASAPTTRSRTTEPTCASRPTSARCMRP
jgi:uncharacterized protein (DUF1501 family)